MIKVFNAESIIEMSKCFSSSEEVTVFINNVELMTKELKFIMEVNERFEDMDLRQSNLIKSIIIVSLFYREHIELMGQLLNTIKFDEITEEEYRALQQKQSKEVNE